MHLQQYAAAMRRLAERHGVGWFGEFAQLDGEYIHYCAAGDGPAVVLLHGLLAWSYTWRHNLGALSAAGYRAYAPDLRGFGLTARVRGGYSLWDQARLVLRWMDAMGLDRAVLVGNSMGGEVSLRAALAAPERVAGLVLVCSSGYARAQVPREIRLALALPGIGQVLVRRYAMNLRFVQDTLAAAYADPGRVQEDVARGYLLPAYTPGAAGRLLRLLRELDFGATAAAVSRVQHPALVVWGARDPWTPLEHGRRLAAELPRAELHVFPDAGHMPHEEHADEFNRLVLDWLARLDW